MTQSSGKTTARLSERKDQAIRRGGTAVFLRLGYGDASMEQIAAEAGVSKQTVYNHFHSKEALFRAIIEDLSGALTARLAVRDPAGSPPEGVLRDFGQDFLSLMLRPTSLALHRLIVAEAGRFPELGAAVYAAGPGRIIAMLADYLAWETRNGRLTVADPPLVAEAFIGMLAGRLQHRALFGVGGPPGERELQRRIDHAVASLLALYGPAARPLRIVRGAGRK